MAEEKTEEQIAREKAAVDAMRNARANMDASIHRIDTLEVALRRAVEGLRKVKGYVSPAVYAYPLNGKAITCHDEIDEHIARAQMALG